MKNRLKKLLKGISKEEIQQIMSESLKQPKIEEQQDGKNIKTSELHECPDCHKLLTYRTLKYSHPSVCPAKNPPAEKKTKQKVVEIQDDQPTTSQSRGEAVPPPPPLRRSYNARSERFKQLAQQAC